MARRSSGSLVSVMAPPIVAAVMCDGRTIRESHGRSRGSRSRWREDPGVQPESCRVPDRGWTKLDVVEHFVTVLPGAFRAVRDRPTMLKRYLQGVGTDPIYQKRAKPGDPFDTVQIRFPSQRPGRMNVPRKPADVVRLAQLGCLDFHPWPVRAGDTDHPDELRLDFDPTPGFGFAEVKERSEE